MWTQGRVAWCEQAALLDGRLGGCCKRIHPCGHSLGTASDTQTSSSSCSRGVSYLTRLAQSGGEE